MNRELKILPALLLVSLTAGSAGAHAGGPGLELGTETTQIPALARAATADSDGIGTLGLELDIDGFQALWNRGVAVIRDFPLPDRRAVDLELIAFNILTPSAKAVVVDRGVEREVPWPATRHFRGVVAGDPNSLVSLNLSADSIAGFIRAWGEEFSFGKRTSGSGRSNGAPLEIWNETLISASRTPTRFCEDPPVLQPGDRQEAGSNASDSVAGTTAGAGYLVADIAIDSTVEWFEAFGSSAATQTQILNTMAQVSTLYEDQLQIQLQVPYVRVFESEPDPYDGASMDAAQLLSEMFHEWNDHQVGVTRTAAHLFSWRAQARGQAFINTLCQNNLVPGASQDYAASLMPGLGSMHERNLVAHELGHTFGSRHTHCYEPEIDRCVSEPYCYQGPPVQTVGTLMSRCDSTVPEFHRRVRDEAIHPAALAAVPLCMDVGGEPIAVDELRVAKASCKYEGMVTDDGETNGTETTRTQITWVKRLAPPCYPFALRRVDALMPYQAVGREMLVVVYADISGSGDPANATLVHTQPVTPSSMGFLEFELDQPVHLVSGDFYLGFKDLIATQGFVAIAARDNSGNFHDSYVAADSLDPEDFELAGDFTWMIRGFGGGPAEGFITLDWTAKCGDAEVLQDYAIYRGQIGAYDEYSALTCTSGLRRYLQSDGAEGSFFLIVPQTSLFEGSYGRDSQGRERRQADEPCRPQLLGTCPE